MKAAGAMSKAAELAILDEAIGRLGADSYLGPWLTSVRAEVEMTVRADWAPIMLPRDAQRAAVAILDGAKLEAASLMDRTRERAQVSLDATRKECENIRADAARALRASLRQIEGGR